MKNLEKISPDDPRLTAYALDEMSAVERLAFEPLLQSDAAAQQIVAEIREAGALLAQALEGEAAEVTVSPEIQPVARAAIILGRDPNTWDGGPLTHRQPYPKAFLFPYWKVTGLAAACFAVGFVIWQQNYQPPVRKTVREIALAPATESAGSLPTNTPPDPAAEPFKIPESLLEASRQIAASPQSVFAGQAQAWGTRPTFYAGNGVKSARSQAGGGGAAMGTRLSYFSTPSRSPIATEAYAFRKDNDYHRVADAPLSTFSVDVDTASYANVRRFLAGGKRPPVDAVRIEELVNYFPYASYRAPEGDAPFATQLEVASAPWAPEHRLVRIGIKGREVSDAARPAANLVFLVDVSGSMNQANKLPLLQKSLRLLVEKLRPDDSVAIAVYAGSSGLALPATKVARKADILEAIDRLSAGGSTNGALGIQLAYDLAKANFVEGGVNRVILATDGDFNVGTTSEGELVRLIQEKAKSGVYLSVLGFGMGNLKDGTLEQLADKGNGNYAYIDTLQEARKTLVEQAGGTLVTIAKDVKLQIEFNPAAVQAYRLIGYENRGLAKEDFNNDAVDAGEIGAGHTVTALYEIVPAGATVAGESPAVDELKYQRVTAAPTNSSLNGELLTVKIRYKEPAGDVSQKLEFPLRDAGATFAEASEDFKFAAAVAAFGMALRDSPHQGALTLADVSAWARAGIGSDAGGYRTEFLSLVAQATRVME